MNKHNNACSNFPIHHFSNSAFQRKQILLKHVNYDVYGFLLHLSKYRMYFMITRHFSPIVNDNDMLQIITCNASFYFANDIYMK